MTKIILGALFAVLLGTVGDVAAEVEVRIVDYQPILSGAGGDTLYVMGPQGSGSPHHGDFEAGDTLAENGWTGVDLSTPQQNHWQVAPNPETADPALVCGSTEFNGQWGYGNDWYDQIGWERTIPFPSQPTDLTIEFDIAIDIEYETDFLNLYLLGPGGCPQLLASYTGEIGRFQFLNRPRSPARSIRANTMKGRGSPCSPASRAIPGDPARTAGMPSLAGWTTSGS